MPDFVHILADNDVGKILVPLIIFVIWVVSAIASALGKQKPKRTASERQWQETLSRLPQDPQRSAEAIRDILRGQAPVQPPPLRAEPPPLPAQTYPQQRPLPAKKIVKPPRLRPAKSRVAAPPRAPQIESAPPSQRPVAAEPSEQVASRLVSVDAAEIGKAPGQKAADALSLRSLLHPANLRRQIAIMEIISPPVTLRNQGPWQ